MNMHSIDHEIITEHNVRDIILKSLDDSSERELRPRKNSSQQNNRGIVICGGRAKYFACAWVCIRMLRKVGCRLPIELWAINRYEIDRHMSSIVEDYDVRVRFVDDYTDDLSCTPHLVHCGWSIKPLSILMSAFDQVLYLDADNMPIHDPTPLFDSREFAEHGAIFWPDVDIYGDSRLWYIHQLELPVGPEFESGQIVIDKPRCQAPLRATVFMNRHHDFYYEYTHGDKDTFRLAWHLTQSDYYLIPKQPIKLSNGTLQQHDPSRRVCFQHRCGDAKWDFEKPNFGTEHTRDILCSSESFEFLSELKALWDGSVGCDVVTGR